MKKILVMLGLSGGMIISQGQAADSTITITGNVQDNTCQVDVGSQDFTVDLQTYTTKQFTKQGSASAAVPFSVSFSACGSAASGVRIVFNGVSVANDNALLKNDATGNAATGIGVQILSADQGVVPVNQQLDELTWTPLKRGQPNNINFYARMVANTYPVTGGMVRAMATMTLEFQ